MLIVDTLPLVAWSRELTCAGWRVEVEVSTAGAGSLHSYWPGTGAPPPAQDTNILPSKHSGTMGTQ